MPLFFPPLPCTGDATALRLPEVGLLAERGWDEVGGREPGNDNNLPINDHVSGATIQAESDTRVKENNSRAFLKRSCLLRVNYFKIVP